MADSPSEPIQAPPRATTLTAAIVWNRVLDHKMIQWGLAYLGAALALAHGQELVGHAFHWPEGAGRVFMLVLIVGFPIALTIAWYHGHRGLQRFSAGELTIIALLAVIGALFFTVFLRPVAHVESVVQQPEPAAAREPRAAAAASARPRLAILPFRNLSPDPSNEFFADAIHEEVTATLTNRAPGLDVIPSTTMMLYRASPKAIADVAAERHATHALDGSVRREGDSVRVTLTLTDAAADRQLWSRSYDRTLVSAITLQSEIANEVANQLSVQILHPPGAAAITGNPEAYDLYLKAALVASSLNRGSTQEVIDRARAQLDRAIALDPEFGLAYLLRATLGRIGSLSISGYFPASSADLRLARADLEAARGRLGDDPRIPATEAWIGWAEGRDPAESIAAMDAAVAAGLSDPQLLVARSAMLARVGRFDDALAAIAALIELNPRDSRVLGNDEVILRSFRRPMEALRILELGVSLSGPQPTQARYFSLGRGRLFLEYTGSTDELEAALEREGELVNAESRFGLQLDVLRFEHRYEEMRALIAAYPSARYRLDSGGNLGLAPVALARGQAGLLLEDRGLASDAGRELLELADSLETTQRTRAPRESLLAEAHLFRGDNARAVDTARAALRLAAEQQDLLVNHLVLAAGARVFAWGGAKDDAAELLERLSTVSHGLAPAEITRDPLYSVPLADNGRYRALSTRLEAQIAATPLR